MLLEGTKQNIIQKRIIKFILLDSYKVFRQETKKLNHIRSYQKLAQAENFPKNLVKRIS